jgi:hypothetical protein
VDQQQFNFISKTADAAQAANQAAHAVRNVVQGAAFDGQDAAAAATGVGQSMRKLAQSAVSATRLMVDTLGDAVVAVAEAQVSSGQSKRFFPAQQAAATQWARLLFVEAVKPLRRLHGKGDSGIRPMGAAMLV